MKKIQTNQTKEKFYEKLNMEYQKERNHDKWHPCTHLIKKDGKYYVYYRSGKNVYKWSVLSPIRCKTLLDGGRRRTKNLYGVIKRPVPAGQVRQ